MSVKPRSITPHLWFKKDALKAAKFYVTLLEDSRITGDLQVPGNAFEGTGIPDPRTDLAEPLVVNFTLAGQPFIALNGGPEFTFNESFSIAVEVDTQQEVDELWKKLTADGGQESMCGWLKDRWGLSWQIIPKMLNDRLTDKDPVKAKRAMDAMLKMQKIDIAKIEAAYAGR